MKPALTGRGLTVAGVALAMLVSGTVLVTWPLVALGFMQLCLLLAAHLLFVSHVAAFRHKCLEFAWWVPAGREQHGAIQANREVTLRVLLRNRSPVSFRGAEVALLGSETIRFRQRAFRVDLPQRQEQHFALRATPTASGTWFLQGALIRVFDSLGLFALQAYFPNRLSMRVFPPVNPSHQGLPIRPRTGTAHERAGPRLLRQRGLGSDLRELRDHHPGDPFKRIDWKATARSRRLVVREFESEILLTLQILIDISPTMRDQLSAGETKLERCIHFAGSLARAALLMGDRVGLWSFDFRPYRHVAAGDGTPQLQRILDLLLELHQVVDEDLTDLTDAELYSLVARYLAHQEGPDLRLRRAPPAGSRRWDTLVAGASGEAIDGAAMEQAVKDSFDKQTRKRGGSRFARHVANTRLHARASSHRLSLLRLFCRFRGIELPYRQDVPVRTKQTGLTRSLGDAATSRATRFVVILTDLQNVGDPMQLLSTLKLCRQRRQTVSVVMPLPLCSTAVDPTEATLLNHLNRIQATRQTAELQRAIEALGFPVLPLDTLDGFHPLVRSIVAHR